MIQTEKKWRRPKEVKFVKKRDEKFAHKIKGLKKDNIKSNEVNKQKVDYLYQPTHLLTIKPKKYMYKCKIIYNAHHPICKKNRKKEALFDLSFISDSEKEEEIEIFDKNENITEDDKPGCTFEGCLFDENLNNSAKKAEKAENTTSYPPETEKDELSVQDEQEPDSIEDIFSNGSTTLIFSDHSEDNCKSTESLKLFVTCNEFFSQNTTLANNHASNLLSVLKNNEGEKNSQGAKQHKDSVDSVDEVGTYEKDILNQLFGQSRFQIRPEYLSVFMVPSVPKWHPTRIEDIPWAWLKEEKWRLHTFAKYPHNTAKSAILLAADGFAYIGSGTGSDDKVICCFCGSVKRNWQPDAVISEVHSELHSKCPMVTKIDCDNVPLITPANSERLTRRLKNNPSRGTRSNNVRESDTVSAIPQLISNLRAQTQMGETSQLDTVSIESENEAGNIPNQPQNRPELTENPRRRSATCSATPVSLLSPESASPIHSRSGQQRFSWNVSGTDTPFSQDIVIPRHNQAAQPFRYEDTFSTHPMDHSTGPVQPAVLRDARPDQDLPQIPMLQYQSSGVRNRPTHLSLQGTHHALPQESSASNVAYQSLARIVPREENCTTNDLDIFKNTEEFQPFKLKSSTSADRARAKNPAAKALIDSGFKEEDVRQEAITAGGCVLEAEKMQENLEGQGKGIVGGQTGNFADHGGAGSSNGWSQDEDQKQRLRKENKHFRDQTVCKVCMDREVSIVFLPCGHLTCCAYCSNFITRCPVCRKSIQDFVKAYFT